MSEQIQGKVSKIFYHQRNYIIGKLYLPISKNSISFKGNTSENIVMGIYLELSGNFVPDVKYGTTFIFDTCFIKQSYEHIYEDFLRTKIAGIGEITFKKLWELCGENCVKVIKENNYEAIRDKNIGISMASLSKFSKIMETLSYKPEDFIKLKILTNDLLKTRKLEKLIDQYSGIDNVLNIINTDVYSLSTFKGLSFTILDNIVKNNPSFMDTDPQRIVYGCYHVLNEINMEGHSCLPKAELQRRVDKLLNIATMGFLDEAIKNDLFYIYEENYIYIKSVYEKENYVVNKIKMLLDRGTLTIENDIIRDIVEQGHLYEDQKQALLTLLTSPFSVLTGPPGTGKTYTIKSLIDYFKLIDRDKKIALAAPTGKAARRVSEQSGHSASTIHLMLRVTGSDGEDFTFEYDANNNLPYDIIIIDESSMLNLELAYYLFSAINLETIVILIGDHNQLPPIGAGYLLKSLIDAKEKVPVVTLTEIKRQAKGSMIIQNCHNIIHEAPIIYNAPNSDFQFIEIDGIEDIKDKCLELLDNYGMDKTQIITPLRQQTDLSCYSLNYTYRDVYIQNAQRLYNFKQFRVGDKVIQNSNHYGYNIYNGQIGYIKGEDNKEGPVLVVDFDGREVVLAEEDTEGLSLAYAITGHKFQGSESEYTIIPVHQILGDFLVTKNWIYTAISRAKKLCMLVGQKHEFELSLQRNEDNFRYTIVNELFNN